MSWLTASSTLRPAAGRYWSRRNPSPHPAATPASTAAWADSGRAASTAGRARISGANAQSGSTGTHRGARHGTRPPARVTYPARSSRAATRPAANSSHFGTGCRSGSAAARSRT